MSEKRRNVMMETMKKWQMWFENEAGVRWAVYLCAFVLTTMNWRVMTDATEASARLMLGILTIPTTLAVYYISGGIETCWWVIKGIAKIVNVIFVLFILICPFAVGWLLLISRIVSCVWCCFAAYGIPVVGVPLVGFIRRKALLS